ncbi:MAG: hypothetical protein KF819_32695, partial [Labilithrix sp.]|nr:hypothetical protein [Labilithrix sp.]
MGRFAPSSLVRPLFVIAVVCAMACGTLLDQAPDDPTPAPDAATTDATPEDGGSDGAVRAPGTAIVDIAAGNSSTCIVVANGSVYCWGSNHRKQLGAATAPETCAGARPCSRRPMRVDGITDAKSVAVGDAWACVVHATGAVSCWGSNAQLQLGHGGSDEMCDGVSCNATPVLVTGLPDRAVQVAVGGSEEQGVTCARLQSGAVYCWGSNDVGQLGAGLSTAETSVAPVEVEGISTARFITAAPQGGNLGVCAVLASNELSCWGSGKFWMIGRAPPGGCDCFPTAAKPTLAPDADIATIGIADGTSVVARMNGSVFVYGFPGYALKPVGSMPEQVMSVSGLP